MPRYDEGRFQVKQFLAFADSTGISVSGTQASNAILMQFAMPRPIVITDATMNFLTGGTAAAGTVIALQSSLAGTGALTTFASYTFNTHANNASVNFSVGTNNIMGSGDVVALVALAGTAALTPKVNILASFKEYFSSAGTN